MKKNVHRTLAHSAVVQNVLRLDIASVILLLTTLLEMIDDFYLRHGFEFDCNQEASLVRGVSPVIDFNNSICIILDDF